MSAHDASPVHVVGLEACERQLRRIADALEALVDGQRLNGPRAGDTLHVFEQQARPPFDCMGVVKANDGEFVLVEDPHGTRRWTLAELGLRMRATPGSVWWEPMPEFGSRPKAA